MHGVQRSAFELLLLVKQTACLSRGKQTTTAVDQQGGPFSVLQGCGQPACPFGCVEKTIDAGKRQLAAATPQPGRLIELISPH